MENSPQQPIDPSTLTKKERRMLRREERKDEQKKTAKSKKKKRILWWGGGVVILAGLAALVIWGASQSDRAQITASSGEITETDWVKGNPEAEVVLVEYGDFQCPACRSYYPIVNALAEEFGEEIGFVFRHFPLYRTHPNAEIAALAAEAAGLQGKFWEMHDMLFENQQSWSNSRDPESIFSGYANDLELDVEKFTSDLGNSDLKDKVTNDYQGGIGIGINSTPTFFLNGEHISNPPALDAFREVIQQALAANS